MNVQRQKKPVTIVIEEDYLRELHDRLTEYGIKQVELAQELGKSESQISRMFTRGVEPRLTTVVEIEQAIARIRVRKAREMKRGA